MWHVDDLLYFNPLAVKKPASLPCRDKFGPTYTAISYANKTGGVQVAQCATEFTEPVVPDLEQLEQQVNQAERELEEAPPSERARVTRRIAAAEKQRESAITRAMSCPQGQTVERNLYSGGHNLPQFRCVAKTAISDISELCNDPDSLLTFLTSNNSSKLEDHTTCAVSLRTCFGNDPAVSQERIKKMALRFDLPKSAKRGQVCMSCPNQTTFDPRETDLSGVIHCRMDGGTPSQSLEAH